ncbi:MAG: diadenylate cyclase [Phycisphaerales bacterium]|nr:diadenylate cyclase [Phycisphaerales bacterium]MDP7087068.1 diadenylate cyclase [Phycisphaerales bacterium]MDP7189628.1 diadenylate cyclase [Phycisphaerales bacterium]MDP7519527.1 diadenylate cyclase [Phycisphaerales bacterium]MDP7573600.1 diadenylate cyclase [Phycisphaerales bacterium]
MAEPGLVANLLIESAAGIARSAGAKAIVVSADALPEGCEPPEGTLLLTRRPEDERRVEELGVAAECVLQIPQVELDRMGQVKLAALVAVSRRLVDFADTVVFLTGPFRGLIDSLIVLHIGSEYELLHATEQPTIAEHIKRTVFQQTLDIALHLGSHGREGRRIGAMLVVGDTNEVLAKSEQMILNPFQGYPEKSRNILDQRMTETIREYAQLDGAILIRGNGTIESAGTRVLASSRHEIESGLGARHAAAAGITDSTRSIALTVSSTDGTVRIWRAGKLVASLEPGGRG